MSSDKILVSTGMRKVVKTVFVKELMLGSGSK